MRVPPTVVVLDDGCRVYVGQPRHQVEKRIAWATRRGYPKVQLEGRYYRLGSIKHLRAGRAHTHHHNHRRTAA